MMDDIRTSLKAIQWERAKGELRAFAALAGSYKSEGKDPYITDHYQKWLRVNNAVEFFITQFESLGLQE